MNKAVTLLFFLFGLLKLNAQTASSITNIQTPDLDETSGLLFLNSKLITHTDSGGEAKLYEVSTTTGNITRTVVINNATNVDWEDITQDVSHIYIGDIGNNNGNRTNLKIYKILKSDYNDMDDIVTAEIISYSYADQTDFTSNPNNNNWDAEGIISYGDKILVFTKNWADKKVNVYSIPKNSGTHIANLESSYNVNGLITGVDVSPNETEIYLTGYSNTEAPFMYTIHNIPSNSLDIFSGNISEKIANIVPLGNQVEGITLFEITTTKHRLYISNEKYIVSFGPISIPFPAKVWILEIDTSTLSIPNIVSDFDLNIYQNPFDSNLKLSKKVDEIVIYDLFGRQVIKEQFAEVLSLENINSGIYIVHLKINNSKFIRKIIKK